MEIRTTHNRHSRQTHCKNGHEFNEASTYISPKSQKRTCRICTTNRVSAQYRIDIETSRVIAREHMREWRATNKERDKKNWTELRRRKKEWLDQQKTACIKCGESHIACLDFHHVDSSKKDANLSEAIARWSIRRLKLEVDKCVMVCSNCHRKLHWHERNSEVPSESVQ